MHPGGRERLFHPRKAGVSLEAVRFTAGSGVSLKAVRFTAGCSALFRTRI